MHKTTMYENLRDMVETEISDIEKSGITKDNLDHLFKLTMSLKAIDKHLCLLEEEDGYSNNYPRNYPKYRYSRDNAKMKMVNKLETLMDDTMSDSERMAIRDCINRINNG